MGTPDDWLHLFTSNIRELYVQDALSLLAAPDGLRYRFRYEERHVDDGLRSSWKQNELTGRSVAVYFSLQHPLNFHAAAFIPLRTGVVASSAVEGGIYIVDFKLAGYIPLVETDRDSQARPVREFTGALKGNLHGAYPDNTDENYARSPQRRSAAAGGSPLSLNDQKGVQLIQVSHDEAVNFERVVGFVSPCVRPARPFFRIARFMDGDTPIPLNDQGWLTLTPEKSYTLEIVHFEPEPLDTSAALKLEVPDSVQALSETTMPLRSRYDVIQVRLFVPARDHAAQGEIVLSTDVGAGPSIRIPIEVIPTKTQTYLSPTSALLGAALVAIPGVMGDGDTGFKVLLAVAGVAFLGFSAFNRRVRGLPA